MGSVAVYSCNIGYRIKGSKKQRKCRRNLRWSGGKRKIKCISKSTKIFLNYRLKCRRYFRDRDSHLDEHFIYKNINTYLPLTENRCYNPGNITINNGNVTFSDKLFEEFTTISFECDNDYELIGDEDIVCLNGYWSSQRFPLCKSKKDRLLLNVIYSDFSLRK